MIFVTIGTQLPFPRLIGMMAALAPALSEEIVAQVGPDPGTYAGITTHASLAPAEFGRLFARARVVVGHAGIGTILSAKANGKPLVLVPRRHDLGEHRNDHQRATARQVADLEGIHIAETEAELAQLLTGPPLVPTTPAPGPRSAGLIARLRTEIAR